MKFPRNARIFRGHLDPAPFVAVFFLLVIFTVLASMAYSRGFVIKLPSAPASELSGFSGPAVAVAIDGNDQLYYKNQLIQLSDLRQKLRQAAQHASSPLTLVIQADKGATYEKQVQLASLACESGANIGQVLWQVLPRPFDTPRRDPPAQ